MEKCNCHCHNNHGNTTDARCKCLPNCEHCNPVGFANNKKRLERIKLTLFIDTWYSTCGNCKKGADPEEKKHERVLGYGIGENEKGCGVEWRYVSTNYSGLNMQQRLERMRPDLEFTGDIMF